VLKPCESRDYWSTNNFNQSQIEQVFVDGAINNRRVKIMLDTGANISIFQTRFARELSMEIFPFQKPRSYNVIADTPLAAQGRSGSKSRLEWTLRMKQKSGLVNVHLQQI